MKKKSLELVVGDGLNLDGPGLQKIVYKIQAEGFVPLATLQATYGPELTTQAVAILFRTYRVLREVRRPWAGDESVLGYEWADKRYSKAEIAKLPPVLSWLAPLVGVPMGRYSGFESVTLRCQWTAQVMGAIPADEKTGGTVNRFDRDIDGNIMVLRYSQRAMAADTLQVLGKEKSLARHIKWSDIIVTPEAIAKANAVVDVTSRPVQDGGQGKGLTRSERLTPGVEFTIEALVPTSALSKVEFLNMITAAGKHTGLSPARSAGFGSFRVLSAV